MVGVLVSRMCTKRHRRLCCSFLAIALLILLVCKVTDLLPYVLLRHAKENTANENPQPIRRPEPVPPFFHRCHNFDCYGMMFQNASMERMAPAIIHDVMRLFAGCMANVIISSKSESVVREGYTSLQASLNCLSDLRIYHSRYRWKYALMLQGKDFPLRTNRELVDILTLYDGANDVELLPPMPERFNWSHSYIKNQEGLPIDIEDKDGPVLKSPPPASLTIYKGSTGAALSAKFVDFMMDDPRSRELQQWLQDTALPDECLWSTINHDERLKAPGGYPGSCLWKSDKKKDWISRFAIWGGTPDDSLCKEWRHGVCLIGVDELPHIVRREELFMNKFWIRDDPIALDCLHEHLFNRTYKLSPIMNSFSLSSYKNLSPVRFQQLVRRLGYVIATKLFKC